MLSPRLGLAALILWMCTAIAVPAAAQSPDQALPPPGPPPLTAPGQSGTADDGFVPISELPPDERLPAAPMLVAAYVFVVLALFAYLLSVSRRLGSVKQEISRLEAETRRSGQR